MDLLIFDGKNYEIRHLLLIGHVWHHEICDRIGYLKSEKSGITDSINHNFARIRIDSYNSLPTEKILTFHNVITPIKLVVNKNKNECNNNKFLGKVCIKINPIHDIIK